MKEIFENAYEAMKNSLSTWVEVINAMGQLFCVFAIYITAPIWFIPYSLFRKKTGGDENEK